MSLDISQAYQQMAGFNKPNPMQQEVWAAMHQQAEWGVGVLLKAPTGSGKTEAVSIPTLAFEGEQQRRLIMVYPSRSLVDDQIGRFSIMLQNLSKSRQQTLTLVVDTGAQSERLCWQNGKEIKLKGNTRRHLYRGEVIITTLDKFLFRFFGFGETKKSYIYPLRIHYGAKKTLICFDEAHAYDDVAFTNFSRLVKTLYQKGLDVVLMTATMPDTFAQAFDYLDIVDFTQGVKAQELVRFQGYQYPDKQLTYLPISIQEAEVVATFHDKDVFDIGLEDETTETTEPAPAITEILAQTQRHYQATKRLIVTVEKVTDAVYLYRQLVDLGLKPLLYHGRLTGKRRKEVYQTLKYHEAKKEGYLLISTSAIEVGCDLDAHVLITQLCDPERLIQRAGRCNRKQAMPDAQIIVVGDTIPAWLTSFQREQDLHDYITELQRQHGQAIATQKLAECIKKVAEVDYHIEMMFDMLYDYVYHAKLENKGLHDKGLLFTRSWEPTITLCTGCDAKGQLENAVDVPISRCRTKKAESSVSEQWSLYKRTFDNNTHKFELGNVSTWESAYATDLVAILNETWSNKIQDIKEIGYVELPALFNVSYATGYRRFMIIKEGDTVKSRVWYLDKLEDIPTLVAEETTDDNEDEE